MATLLLWLLTLIGGPLSFLAHAAASEPKMAQCALPRQTGTSCCCAGETSPQAPETSASLAPVPDTADCSCALTEAPLPATDETPRLPLAPLAAVLARPASSAPCVPNLRRVLSPHVGTLAPPLRARKGAPDSGRAPPRSF